MATCVVKGILAGTPTRDQISHVVPAGLCNEGIVRIRFAPSSLVWVRNSNVSRWGLQKGIAQLGREHAGAVIQPTFVCQPRCDSKHAGANNIFCKKNHTTRVLGGAPNSLPRCHRQGWCFDLVAFWDLGPRSLGRCDLGPL